jgi:micrococcal nuclease
MTPLYTYRGRCLKVVDGDTIDVLLDVGFHGTRTERLRLLGVNAPEMHGPSHEDGQAAKDFAVKTLTEWRAFDEGWPIIVRTEKSDVFGRYLALVSPGAGVPGNPFLDLSSVLLSSGHAIPYRA